MGKSQKAVSQDVPYGSGSYNTPFGKWSFNGQNWKSTLSPAQQKQLDFSQSSYYDIVKNLPTDGPFGSASMNNFSNPNSYLGSYNQAYLDTMDRQVGRPLEQKVAGQYGGDSTIGRYAINDYLTKSRDQGIMSSANLANQNYQGMLSGMAGVGGGIQDIYNRMMGIANQGLGSQNSWLNNAQQNANRAFQASQVNSAAANKRQTDMWNAIANLTGVGMMAGGKMFGDANKVPFFAGSENAGQAYNSMYGNDIPMDFGYQGYLSGNDGGGGSGNGLGGFASGAGGYDTGSLSQIASLMGGGSPSGSINAAYGAGYGNDDYEGGSGLMGYMQGGDSGDVWSDPQSYAQIAQLIAMMA